MQSLNLSAHTTALPSGVSACPSSRVTRSRRQSAATVRASAAVADNGTAVEKGVAFQINDVFPPAQPEPVSEAVQAMLDEQGLDYEASGLKFLTNEARERALAKKANKIEKLKNKKGGHAMWGEVHELGQLIRREWHCRHDVVTLSHQGVKLVGRINLGTSKAAAALIAS
ncbi:TPA: hypothetical protein ACH3X1_011245 [Trebouxia sp. C0004]